MDFKNVVEKVSSTIVETGRQVGEIVTEKARAAKDYAKDAMDVASLKNQIASCQDVVKSGYQTLGEYYYKNYEENPAAEVVESVRAIENAQATIKELEVKIQEIKDAQTELKAAKAAAAAAEDDGAVADVDAEVVEEAVETPAAESVDDELEQVKKDSDNE